MWVLLLLPLHVEVRVCDVRRFSAPDRGLLGKHMEGLLTPRVLTLFGPSLHLGFWAVQTRRHEDTSMGAASPSTGGGLLGAEKDTRDGPAGSEGVKAADLSPEAALSFPSCTLVCVIFKYQKQP